MLEETKNTPWQALAEDEVLNRLDTSLNGLANQEAENRLRRTGPNALEVQEGLNPLRLIFQQVNNPLIYLLLGAVVISLIAGKYIDALVIAGVIVLNTIIGFIQEWRAEGALAALRKMSAPQARLLRNGEVESHAASEIVPGDVLLLEAGDVIAADARLFAGDDLQVDESALTGESQPAAKLAGRVNETTPVADRHNMVWMSTSITTGRGRAVVVETGMQTQLGEIAGAVRATARAETPLQKRMKRLGTILGLAGVILASVVFVLGLFRGFDIIQMLLFSVAVLVSAAPEGLPAVISVTLALGVQRMARQHAIIRRLPAVETLGSTTVICTDKTGTITENQMTVRRLWAGGREWEVTGEGYEPKGQVKDRSQYPLLQPDEALLELLKIGIVANNSALRQSESHLQAGPYQQTGLPAQTGLHQQTDGYWQVEGDPNEGALLVVAHKAGLDPAKIRGEWPRLHELPFSSESKYMATLNERPETGDHLVYVKGAPDRLLNFCNTVQLNGKEIELKEEHKQEITRITNGWARQGLRVLGGACRTLSPKLGRLKPEEVQVNLTLVGLWGMLDPPRKESVKAVADAKAAGIRPIMITGDHAMTATAIAQQVGITEKEDVLTGADIERLSKPELAVAALETGVLARVSPANKLKLTEALKEQGQVVAMTGDGVNDAPALKNANIGIAMGQTGTEVAKEAADMVLTDDNFATIVNAIEEGRVIFSNLRRVIFFLLATNLGEIVTLIGALLLGLELPLTAIMVLWVNLVTDGVCTVPLGIEPRHRDVLKQPPRNPSEPILNRPMLLRMFILIPIMALGTLGLFWYALRTGTLIYARSVAFTTLVTFQWFQAFNARSFYLSVFSIGLFTNRWLLMGVGAAIVLQVLVIQTPFGQVIFGTVPLHWFDWLLIIAVSSSIWIIDELLKKGRVYGKPR